MEALMKNDYRYNTDFRNYVDKYCQKQGISIEDAMQHVIAREVWRQYTEL